MRHRTGTDQSTGGFLTEPGTYHLCVVDATEYPTNKDGALIDNAAFRITCEVLAGTVAGQETKQKELTFFYPKPSDKNEGAFARKKIDRFLMAIGLISEEDKDKEVDVNIDHAVGRQFIATFEKDDGGKYLNLAFSEIYHVDDPAKKTIPKNENALKLIPAAQRRIGSRPTPATKPAAKPAPKPSANGGQAGHQQPTQFVEQPPAPGEAADEWNL